MTAIWAVQEPLFLRGKKVEFMYLVTKGTVGLQFVSSPVATPPPPSPTARQDC
jgi:hypothetical protein